MGNAMMHNTAMHRTENNNSPILSYPNNNKSQYNTLGGVYIGELYANDNNNKQQNPFLFDNNHYNDDYTDEENEDIQVKESKQFINDLVWLEKRISEARTAATSA